MDLLDTAVAKIDASVRARTDFDSGIECCSADDSQSQGGKSGIHPFTSLYQNITSVRSVINVGSHASAACFFDMFLIFPNYVFQTCLERIFARRFLGIFLGYVSRNKRGYSFLTKLLYSTRLLNTNACFITAKTTERATPPHRSIIEKVLQRKVTRIATKIPEMTF